MAPILSLSPCANAPPSIPVGTVRAKNVKAAIFKNMFDHAAGAIGWYWIGYPLFIGNGPFASGGDVDWAQSNPAEYAKLFQQFGFCVTSATIVSGGIISRCKLEVYLIYAFFMASFIYPIVSHWCWNPQGWLAQMGYLDFAGSGVVHLLGGACALVGAQACGPRVGRFAGVNERSEDGGRRGSEFGNGSEHGSERGPVFGGIPFRYRAVNALCGKRMWAYNLVDFVTLNDTTIRVRAAPGHSAAMQCLGALLLYVAWFSFNGGSGGRIDDQVMGELAGRAVVNTMLAAAAGSIFGLAWSEVFCKSFDIDLAINTLIGSLVSVTAACGYVEPWAAIVVGVLSVPVYVGTTKVIMYRFHIDDPLNAVAVHAACGMLGLVWLGLAHSTQGLFYTGDGHFLGVQILGGLCIFAWGCATTALFFYPAKYLILPYMCKAKSVDEMDEDNPNPLCYAHDMQLVGLDFFFFGGSAFPDFDVEAVHEYNATERIKKRFQMKKNKAVGVLDELPGISNPAARVMTPKSSLQQMPIPSPKSSNVRTSQMVGNPSSNVFVMENPNRNEEDDED